MDNQTLMTTLEKAVLLRHLWRQGKGKYIIRIPSDTVKLYKLEKKFLKITLEEYKDEPETT